MTNIPAVGVYTGRTEQIPVGNSFGTQVNIFFDISNPMEIVGIQLASCNE